MCVLSSFNSNIARYDSFSKNYELAIDEGVVLRKKVEGHI